MSDFRHTSLIIDKSIVSMFYMSCIHSLVVSISLVMSESYLCVISVYISLKNNNGFSPFRTDSDASSDATVALTQKL